MTLVYSGSATGADYSGISTGVVIAIGTTGTSFTITATQDAIIEGSENISIDIDTVTGGTEAGIQTEDIAIIDDDVAVDQIVLLALNT